MRAARVENIDDARVTTSQSGVRAVKGGCGMLTFRARSEIPAKPAASFIARLRGHWYKECAAIQSDADVQAIAG